MVIDVFGVFGGVLRDGGIGDGGFVFGHSCGHSFGEEDWEVGVGMAEDV